MPLTLQRDLDRRNVAFDHDFIFKIRSFDFKALITRYRGTNCVPAEYGVIVTAWQKSIYRFGGIPLEETIVATILVHWDGTVHGVSLDRRSHGGLGRLCDFVHLEQCMARILRGRQFGEFCRVCPTAGDAQCLHLFEVLSSASSFYAHLREQGRTSGSEEELLNLYPKRGCIQAVDEHWVLGEEHRAVCTLRHLEKPKTTIRRLPRELHSRMQLTYDGETVLDEALHTAEFPEVYGQMNRILAKFSRIEKKKFGVKGRMRFTNATAFTGLMLLTLAEQSMHILKSVRIGMMLNDLQHGGARDTCVAFSAIQKTYKPKHNSRRPE